MHPTYNNDYTGVSPDPTLSSYDDDEEAVDQDIISTQEYDAVGNLVKTVDPLAHVNYTVYDALNRPVKTVQAANGDATISLNVGDEEYEATVDPRSDDYEISLAPDQDLIQRTRYDRLGRVTHTQRLLENRDSEEQWETTLYGYDTLGRQIKVIQEASDPDYDVSSDPSLGSYTASGDADQDIVTQTVYDPNSRVMYTEDTLGARTWMGYDGLGRQVKTVVNAVGTDTDDGSSDPRSDSYVPSSDDDKDLISTTTYNSDGQIDIHTGCIGSGKSHCLRCAWPGESYHCQLCGSRMTNPADWVWMMAITVGKMVLVMLSIMAQTMTRIS